MMLKAISIGLVGSAIAQSVVDSNTFTITQSADFAPETLLDIHLNDTALADEVFNHGCFCSKIYHWNDKNIRGGHTSLDDFDEICKNWYRCRECNDKHVGGSCKDAGVDPHAQDYDYEVAQNVYDDGSVTYDCSINTEDCAYDSCIIDVEYIEQVSGYLNQFTVAEPFAANAINETSCPRSSEKVVDRFCNGTAPNLYTTKARTVATAAEVLAEHSDTLTGELESSSLNAEGTTCQDGTCGCTGPAARANVLYFRTTTYTSWHAGKALCESMGLTMAEARTTAENSLLTAGEPHSWLGGRRYAESNYNQWVWDSDITIISPTHWNGGEPNNSGGNEQCLQMYTSGRWNDLHCGNNLKIVCQQRTC